MSKKVLLVFSNPVDGREDEYNAWYSEYHLDEILAIDGFVLAQRFRLAGDALMTKDTPTAPYRYLAMYEVDENALVRADAALFHLARTERAAALAAGRTPKLVMSTSMQPDLRTWWYESISEVRTPSIVPPMRADAPLPAAPAPAAASTVATATATATAAAAPAAG